LRDGNQAAYLGKQGGHLCHSHADLFRARQKAVGDGNNILNGKSTSPFVVYGNSSIHFIFFFFSLYDAIVPFNEAKEKKVCEVIFPMTPVQSTKPEQSNLHYLQFNSSTFAFSIT